MQIGFPAVAFVTLELHNSIHSVAQAKQAYEINCFNRNSLLNVWFLCPDGKLAACQRNVSGSLATSYKEKTIKGCIDC
jgi:hypothetical protein